MSHTVTRSALAELSVPDQLVHIMAMGSGLQNI